MSKTLINAAKLYFYRYSNILDCAVAAHQMYTTDSAVGQFDHPAQHSLHPSPNFYRGSKSVKFGIDLRHRSFIEPPSFRNEATVHIGIKVSF